MTDAAQILTPTADAAAWEPFASNRWSRRDAAHLFRRAGLAATSSELDAAVAAGLSATVHHLLNPEPASPQRKAELEILTRTTLASNDPRRLSAWWAYRMLTTSEPAREKMTLFWHGHFATSGAKVTQVRLLHDQNELFREHAFGDFHQLVHGVARDPAMLIYLDSDANRKAHPNENFARELMELFCLGEGEYTEDDIRQLARCFTGWEVRRDQFRFNRYQHDNAAKTIFGKTDSFTGEQGVDLVLAHHALPGFVVSKLARFFVSDLIDRNEPSLSPLAETFRQAKLEVRPLLRQMFLSQRFYSAQSRARKVRSPVDFALGTLRALEMTTDSFQLAQGLKELGQDLFFPPNVKGWDGGRAWINSSTLLGRANLMQRILENPSTRFGGGTFNEMLEKQDLKEGRQIVDWLEDLLFAVPVPQAVRQHVTQNIDAAPGEREQRLRNALRLLCSLPEYQLA